MIDGEHAFPFMAIKIIIELSSENFVNRKISFVNNIQFL